MKLNTIVISLIPFLGQAAIAEELAPANFQYDNPIVVQRADPFIHRHQDSGCYTFIGTSPKFDSIELRQACRLNDLKIAPPKVIWEKNPFGPLSANIWAPELHRIDNAWYIHFAAGEVERPFHIRMFVLKNTHADPMQGEWTNLGQIETPWDSFSLDATTFHHQGKRYLVWAQKNREDTYNSALWMAEMDSPTSIVGEPIQLTKPEFDWEIQGYKVNEGAAVIIRNNKVFITYSASATDHRYAMGLLWADINSDLMNPTSWHKLEQPVFETNEQLNRYGPGHNSFVKAEDGITDLLVYHSRDYKTLRGTPLTDPNRHARVRVIGWDDQGMPIFYPHKSD